MSFVDDIAGWRLRLKRDKIPLQWVIKFSKGNGNAVIFDYARYLFSEEFSKELSEKSIEFLDQSGFWNYKIVIKFASDADEALFLMKVQQ